MEENQASKEHIANKAHSIALGTPHSTCHIHVHVHVQYQTDHWPATVLILTLPKFCLAPFDARE